MFAYTYFIFSLHLHFIISVRVVVLIVTYKTGSDILYEMILHSSKVYSFRKMSFLIMCLKMSSFMIFKTSRKQNVYISKTNKMYMVIQMMLFGTDIYSTLIRIAKKEAMARKSIWSINVSWIWLFSSNNIF